MFFLFKNLKIFKLNVGELINLSNIDNVFEFKFFFKTNFLINKFNGFFFNLRHITLLEIENFLLFLNASYFIVKDNVFKKKLIFFFSFFFNESLIFYFFKFITIDELFYLFKDSIVSFIVIFKLKKKFNLLLNYEIIKFFLHFFRYKKIFNFLKFSEFKFFILNSVSFFDNKNLLYSYFLNNLKLKDFSNLFFFFDNVYIFILEKYFYKLYSFVDLIYLLVKNLILNLYKLFDFNLNNFYSITYFKQYFSFLTQNYKNKFFNILTFFLFLHEINLIYKIYWLFLFYFLKKLKKKTVKVKFINLIFWRLRLDLNLFLNSKIFLFFFNFSNFFKTYIFILYNLFRKYVYIYYLNKLNFNLFFFFNFFLIKFINYLFFFKYLKESILFSDNILIRYSSYFIKNFQKYFILNNLYNIGYFNINYKPKKNFKILKNYFFKNLGLSFIYKLTLFLKNINYNFLFKVFRLKQFKVNFLLFFTNRTLNNFFFFKLSLIDKFSFNFFSNFFNFYPYYVILKNFFNPLKYYLYLPLKYRVISNIEEFFFLITEDYLVEGYEGFYFDLDYNYNYRLFKHFDEEDLDDDQGSDYFFNQKIVYKNNFFIFDIYTELTTFNSYIYFYYKLKYDHFFINNNSYVISNYKSSNIFYQYINLLKSPRNSKNKILYQNYFFSNPFLWSLWSFSILESDFNSYIDLKGLNYFKLIPFKMYKKNFFYKYKKKNFLNNSNLFFSNENFLDSSLISKYSNSKNFENILYLPKVNYFNYVLLYLNKYYFTSIGFLTEKWYWWNIIKYDVNKFFDLSFLEKYFLPKSNEEFIFLLSFLNLTLLGNLKENILKIDFYKLESIYDQISFDFFFKSKTSLSSDYYFSINYSMVLYNIWFKKFVEIIFYFDYIELINYVYELSNYLDLTYFKTLKFLYKIEKLLDFFISQTSINLYYNYYEPFLIKDRMFFFELLFLNIFTSLYKYFQYELEFFSKQKYLVDIYRSKYFIQYIDDLFLPSVSYIKSYETIYDFVNLKKINKFKNKKLKELNINNLSTFFLKFINDPYFLFSNKFNISLSFPELIFNDLYYNYGLYFSDFLSNEYLKINLLKHYKFFDLNQKDQLFDTTSNISTKLLNVFDKSIFSQGFLNNPELLSYLELDFFNNYIGESYIDYIERLQSFSNYNLFFFNNLIKYIGQNNFFLSELLKINDFDYNRNFFKLNKFFFKKKLLFEKLYFFYFNILNLNFLFEKKNYLNFISYLIMLIILTFLYFFKNIFKIENFFSIYFLYLFPIYIFFLIFKYCKFLFKFNILVNFDKLLVLSFFDIIKLVLFVFKELKFFIFFFFKISFSYVFIYLFFYKFYFLFRNLFNINFFIFSFKFLKKILNITKNSFNFFSEIVFLKKFNSQTTFRTYSSLEFFYTYKNFKKLELYDNIYTIFDWLNLNNKSLKNNKFNLSYLKKNELIFIDKNKFQNHFFYDQFFDPNYYNLFNLNKQLISFYYKFFDKKEVYIDNLFFNLDTSYSDLDNYNDYIFDVNFYFRMNAESLNYYGSKIVDEWSDEFNLGDFSENYDNDELVYDITNKNSFINEEFNYELSVHNMFNYVDLYFNEYFIKKSKKQDDYYLNNYRKLYNLDKKSKSFFFYYKIGLKKLIFYLLNEYKKVSYLTYFNLLFNNNKSNIINKTKFDFEKKNIFKFSKNLKNFNNFYLYSNFYNSLTYSFDKNNFNLKKIFLSYQKKNNFNYFVSENIYSLNYIYGYELNSNLDFFLDGLDDREEYFYLSSLLENKYNSDLYLLYSNFIKAEKKKINFLFLSYFYYINLSFFNSRNFEFYLLKLNLLDFVEIFFIIYIKRFFFYFLNFFFFRYIYYKIYYFFYLKFFDFLKLKYVVFNSNEALKKDIYSSYINKNFTPKFQIKLKNFFFFFEFLVFNNLFFINEFIFNCIILLKSFYLNYLSIYSYLLLSFFIFYLLFLFKKFSLKLHKNFFFFKLKKVINLFKNYEMFIYLNNYNMYQIFIKYNIMELLFYINNNFLVKNFFFQFNNKNESYLKYLFVYELVFFFFIILLIFILIFFNYYFISLLSSSNFDFMNYKRTGSPTELEYTQNVLRYYGFHIFGSDYIKNLLIFYYGSLVDTVWTYF